MRQRTAIAALAAALASLGLVACGSSGSSGSGSNAAKSSPFTVLAIVAASGPLAADSAAEMEGLQAAKAYVNAHGGINGHPVKVTIENDNFDPTTAVSLLQSALSGGSKPDMVFAGTTSTETLALMPLLTQNKIFSLQISVSSQTVDPKVNPYAFSSSSSTSAFSAELAHVIRAHYPSAKKAGLLIGNDVNGTSLLASEKPDLESNGFSVSVQTYDPATAIDVTPQLEALKAQNPDILVVSGFGAIAGYILKDRSKIGWNIPTAGDASFTANALTTLATPQQLTNVSVLATNKSQIYKPLSQRDEAFQTLYKDVLPKSGTFSAPFGLYADGWDDIILAKAAATQAGSFASTAMTQALENLKDSTDPSFINGPYKYSASQHSPIADIDLADLASPYTKDGQYLPFGQTG
jgi:branched-chain amino acid transport system substrate-binding protein